MLQQTIITYAMVKLMKYILCSKGYHKTLQTTSVASATNDLLIYNKLCNDLYLYLLHTKPQRQCLVVGYVGFLIFSPTVLFTRAWGGRQNMRISDF